jgi:Protein of unknown function (DUF1344)
MKVGAFKGLFILASLMGMVVTTAPASAQPSAVTVRGVVEGDVVEGRVSRVDPRTRTITLDNGQEYLVPRVLALNWDLLPPGAAVKVRYSVDGGRNVATLLDIRP